MSDELAELTSAVAQVRIEELRAEVERLTAERDHAREALQDEVRLRAELQKRAEAAERQLAESRAEVERLQYENAALRRDIRHRDRLRVADLLTAAHRGAKLPEDHTSGSGEARGEKG